MKKINAHTFQRTVYATGALKVLKNNFVRVAIILYALKSKLFKSDLNI